MIVRLRRALFVVAVALLLSACNVDVTIGIDVSEDGSGQLGVESIFDADAVAAIENFEQRIRLADLRDQGWDVGDPVKRDDGSVRVVVTRQVLAANHWQGALDEIAGPGVFTDVVVRPEGRFAEQAQTVSFGVDLRDGFDLLGDDETTSLLGGEPFGGPIETWTQGRTIDEIVDVTIRASVASDAEAVPAAVTVRPSFDDVVPVELESTHESTLAVLLRWIGWALAALFVLSLGLAVLGLVLERRADRLRPPVPPGASLSDRIPGQVPAPQRAAADPVAIPDSGPVRLVIVDPIRVLYEQHEAPSTYLLPFVRHNGGVGRADAIMETYEQLVQGEVSAERFWEVCELEGNASAETVDETFMKMRSLRSGADAFLTEMERRRIPVAAISNDAAAWSAAVRERDRLTGVWPWLVSAEVGALKPNLGMFELVRRETGVAYEHCLYIDTDVESLDTAKTLGMKTTFFDAQPEDVGTAIGHARVESFAGFFKRRL